MSDVRSKANLLNTAFPLAGANNSSQGFRDNWAATQQGLFVAHDELTRLQLTRLQWTGDAQGQSGRLGSGSVQGDQDPTVLSTFTLADVLADTGQLSTDAGDFQLTLDSKGRVRAVQSVTHVIQWAQGHGAGTALGAQSLNLGTGTGSWTLPRLTFNAMGRLVQTTTHQVSFGLLNHTLAHGSLITGDAQGTSVALPPPVSSGQFMLVAQNGTLGWVVAASGQGAATQVTAGPGIKILGTAEAPQVVLDLGNVTAKSTIQDTDTLAFQDVTSGSIRRIQVSEIRGAVSRLSADSLPSLGGNLLLGNYHIMGEQAQGAIIRGGTSRVTIKPALLELVVNDAQGVLGIQSPTISVNGALWPTTAGSQGQVMTMGPGQQIQWTTPSVTTYGVQGNVLWVSPQGLDTNNGAVVTPLKTIAKALSLIPKSSTTRWTIVIMPGTYAEGLDISNIWNLDVEGALAGDPPRLTGKSILGFNLRRIRLRNLELLDDQDATGAATLVVSAGADDLQLHDVQITRNLTTQSALDLNGEITRDLVLRECVIRGTTTNNLTSTTGAALVTQSLQNKRDAVERIRAVPATRALAIGDAGAYLRVNVQADHSLGLPEWASVPWPLGTTIQVTQIGPGRTSVVPLGNVSLNTPYGYRLRGRWSTVRLVNVDRDVWDLGGDLDESQTLAPAVRADNGQISADGDAVSVDNG